MSIIELLDIAVKLHILSIGAGVSVLIDHDLLDWLRQNPLH